MILQIIREQIRSLEMNSFFVTSKYYKVEELPKLGTGKADFKGLKHGL